MDIPEPSSSALPVGGTPKRHTSLRRRGVSAAGSTSLAGGAPSSSSSSVREGSVRRASRASGAVTSGSQLAQAIGGASGKKRGDRHAIALEAIRNFLKGRSSYDVLPVSFRLVVLDTRLVVRPALDVMWQAGVVSAPLWHSLPPDVGRATPSATTSNLPEDGNAVEPVEASSAPSALPSAVSNAAAGEPLLSSEVPGPAGKTLAARGSSSKPGFAGMLTVNDIIHLIQYYYHHSSYDNAAKDVERFRLEMLRDIEQALHVPTPPLVSIAPLRPLYEACQLLIKTHARRLPLLDHDEQTGMETLISVLTQYRVLKFIAMNCRETAGLYRSVKSLGIGTYIHSVQGVGTLRNHVARAGSSASGAASRSGSVAGYSSTQATGLGRTGGASRASTPPEPTVTSPISPGDKDHIVTSPEPDADSSPAAKAAAAPANPHAPLSTATLDTTVFDVVHMFSERGISAVPILDSEGYAVDMYETVDVIDLVRSGAYQSLDTTIRQALARRPADFGGVMSCSPDDSLASIFALLRTRRVHRLLILEPPPISPASSVSAEPAVEGEEKPPPVRQRGKLVGILCLSDILRYVIGAEGKLPMHGTASQPGTSASGLQRERRGSQTSVFTTTTDPEHSGFSSIPPAVEEQPPPAPPMQASHPPAAAAAEDMPATIPEGQVAPVLDDTAETPTQELRQDEVEPHVEAPAGEEEVVVPE